MLDPKKQLDITLTEPVVFLRSSDPSGRLEPDPNDPPTFVRGILTLNVVKPIGISSIEVELTGLSTVNYPEGSYYLRSILRGVGLALTISSLSQRPPRIMSPLHPSSICTTCRRRVESHRLP